MFFDNNMYIKNVSLEVKDINNMLWFYTEVIGLDLIKEEGTRYYLGVDGNAFITLISNPEATIVRKKTGLYHLAILLPDKRYLGQVIKHIALDKQYRLTGVSDHLVSNAMYLNDPEGNGIEIYADFDSSTWKWNDGSVEMATLAVDIPKLLKEGFQDEFKGMPSGTVLGHVHFTVNDMTIARNYFENTLGFDFLLDYFKQAMFLSTNKYHHHIGANMWLGANITNRESNETGLAEYTLNINDRDTFKKHLETKGVLVNSENDHYTFYDMNNTKVLF